MKRTLIIGLLIALFFPAVAFSEYPGNVYPSRSSMLSSSSYNWKITGSVTYESGDFGTDTTTNTVYVPFTLTRLFSQGNVGLTIPYIYQESGPGVAAIGGRPVQIRRVSGNKRSAEGLGDMILKGTYELINEQSQPFNLAAVGRVKFPTADDEKGLGTGEFDEGGGLEFSKSLDDHWKFYSDFMYTVIGDPSGLDLDNEISGDIGLGYQISEPTSVSIFYEERSALLEDRPNPRDIVLGIQHKANENLNLFGNLSIGLSDGSPDTGVTVGLSTFF